MITVRNRSFDFSQSPKYFYNKNRFVTHFLNALSTTFPPGEHFFVRSVRYYRTNDRNDPLERDISAFIGQEAFHSLAHEKMNAYALKYNIPLTEIQHTIDFLIKQIEKILTPKQCLAITIALEHYTAEMGTELLDNPKWLNNMDGIYKDLWKWHAQEEIEHKDVAYDVYERYCNDYLTRIITMSIINVVFLTAIFIITGRLVYLDDEISWFAKIDETISGLFHLLGRNGFLTNIIKQIPKYYSPFFHP